ncbi:MAG: hypothetical protein ABJA50_13825 [Chloroflexota bacterium]
MDQPISEINATTHALDGRPVTRMQMMMAMYDLLATQFPEQVR